MSVNLFYISCLLQLLELLFLMLVIVAYKSIWESTTETHSNVQRNLHPNKWAMGRNTHGNNQILVQILPVFEYIKKPVTPTNCQNYD